MWLEGDVPLSVGQKKDLYKVNNYAVQTASLTNDQLLEEMPN